MIGFIVGAIIFSIPALYYRAKYIKADNERKRVIDNAWKWQWEDWGE
tara:strand:- start:76 stop:216 length:141 start_codon:yes stop_codon:yes gene_type:complete